MAILLLDCLLASWGGMGGCYLLVCLLSWLGAAWQPLRFKETLLAGCRVRRSRSLVISYSACSTVWYLLASDLLLTCLLDCYCLHPSPECVLDNSYGQKTLLTYAVSRRLTIEPLTCLLLWRSNLLVHLACCCCLAVSQSREPHVWCCVLRSRHFDLHIPPH